MVSPTPSPLNERIKGEARKLAFSLYWNLTNRESYLDGVTPVNRDVVTLFSRLQSLVAGPCHWGRDMRDRGGNGGFNRIIDSDESFEYLFSGLWMREEIKDYLERYPDGERAYNLGVTISAKEGEVPEINLIIIFSTISELWNNANY